MKLAFKKPSLPQFISRFKRDKDEEIEGGAATGDLPVFLLYGSVISGSQKDVDSMVRGIMQRHCYDLSQAGYKLMKYRSGFIYEIKEGGKNRSWLKSIVKRLDEKGSVILPSATRYVRLVQEETGIQCEILPENSKPDDIFTPLESGHLLPYHNYMAKWVVTSVALASFSVICFSASLWMQKHLLENKAKGMLMQSINKTKTLPILYWPEVIGENEIVVKLEFKDGRWLPPIVKSLNEIEAVEVSPSLPITKDSQAALPTMPSAEKSFADMTPEEKRAFIKKKQEERRVREESNVR